MNDFALVLMDRRTRLWVSPLVVWTLAVWISRARNVLNNDELDGWSTGWRMGAVGVFVLLGLACASWLIRGRPGQLSLVMLSVWSVGFWLIRGFGILLDSDYSAGFKFVHTLLMLATLGVVAVAWVGVTYRRRVR